MPSWATSLTKHSDAAIEDCVHAILISFPVMPVSTGSSYHHKGPMAFNRMIFFQPAAGPWVFRKNIVLMATKIRTTIELMMQCKKLTPKLGRSKNEHLSLQQFFLAIGAMAETFANGTWSMPTFHLGANRKSSNFVRFWSLWFWVLGTVNSSKETLGADPFVPFWRIWYRSTSIPFYLLHGLYLLHFCRTSDEVQFVGKFLAWWIGSWIVGLQVIRIKQLKSQLSAIQSHLVARCQDNVLSVASPGHLCLQSEQVARHPNSDMQGEDIPEPKESKLGEWLEHVGHVLETLSTSHSSLRWDRQAQRTEGRMLEVPWEHTKGKYYKYWELAVVQEENSYENQEKKCKQGLWACDFSSSRVSFAKCTDF